MKEITQPGLGLETETRTIHRMVDVKLQPAELGALGVEAGILSGELATAENEFDEVKKVHQAKIKGIDNRLQQTLDKLLQKTESREVECEMVLDFNANSVTVKHEGEIIEERAMTAEERQMSLGEVQHGTVEEAEPTGEMTDEERQADLTETMREERNPNKPSLVDMSGGGQ